ncbi:hypothetical protein B0H17DRAFT_1214975 [Mycena rosella]|uniref:CxC2-like cysteine cluster KDZ transposase-associated domain-containing protein n=1 Tax=Mycena rosella TaxID=1033263 RepID=A0AAD7CLT4_MYCRO|nr:hypothetical protein B0H17DRAFT_1214975 [Mycena rosella]
MNRRGRPRTKNIVDIDEDNDYQNNFTADRGIYFSADGERRHEEVLNLRHKKRRLEPIELDDTLGQWVPVPDDDYEEDAHDMPAAVPSLAPTVLGKRKEYISTMNPILLFRPLKNFFLDELLRHEGLGDYLHNSFCAHCETQFASEKVAGDPWARIFKCYECGVFLQCKACCIAHHARSPLHVIKLGHGGFRCPVPDSAIHRLVVIEAPIIHQIRIRYCKCEKSDTADNLEQLLRNSWYPATVTDPVGNMNVRDFITALDRVTDTTAASGMSWLPERYKQFQRMARQWAFLWRLMRAGRGHDPTGVDATQLGECSVTCWACPYDGRNLPTNWRDVEPKFKFLYMLLLAVDANFRLKNRMRVNEIDDPSLGPGWGYWVEPHGYKRHVKKYVNEKDASTCIAFAALLQKDTRMTTGLRIREHGLCCHGGLRGFTLEMLTISYDIACQWKIHLAERNTNLPEDVKLKMDDVKIHLSFKMGVGKSDGEGVERVWAVLNPTAFSTKDAVGGSGQTLTLVKGKRCNIKGFEIVNRTVSKEVKNVWKKMIVDWLKDDSKPNPYTLSRKDCPSEAEVRLDVRKDEDALTAGGKAPLHGRSATAFLTAGIQIEDTQRRIRSELAGSVLVAADRANKIQEWRHTVLAKISTFRSLQKIYMPGAAAAISQAEAGRNSDVQPPKPENIKLWMPSQMDTDDSLRGCVPGLLGMETKLRVGQCENCLVSLRSRLHAKRFLIEFRNENVTGQVDSTRVGTLIGLVGERVQAHARRYRTGREALLALVGDEKYLHLRPLDDIDLTLDGDWGESDATARKKLAMLGLGRGVRAPRNAPGTSKRVMSWIWTAPGALEDGEARLHDSIRVEWARAQARKARWTEEVMVLREEMRRVLQYLSWQAEWWQARVASRTEGVSLELAAGMRAYALKQSAWDERLGRFFRAKWNLSARAVTQDLVEADAATLEDFFESELATELAT